MERTQGADAATPVLRIRPWLEVAALVVLCLCLLRGFTGQLALHLEDEALILSQGQAILAGRFVETTLVWSPVLSIVYAVLYAVTPRHVILADPVFVGSAVASVVALWWALRVVIPSPAAFLTAAAWASAEPVVQFGRSTLAKNTYLFSSALYLVALGLALRGRRGAAFAIAVVACIERAEFTFWLVAAVVISAVIGMKRRAPFRWTDLLLVAGAIALFAFQQLHPAHRSIRWLTFRQHYSAGTVTTTTPDRAFEVARAFAEGAAADRDFPGATSVAGAARTEPSRFLAHLAGNVPKLPAALAQTLLGCVPPLSPTRWVIIAGVGLLCLLGWARGRARIRARCEPVGLVPKCVAVASTYTLVAALVLAPRPVLLIPLITLWFPLVACSAVAGWECLPSGRAAGRRWLSVALPIAALVSAPFLTGQYPIRDGTHRVLRHTLAALERHGVALDERVLVTHAMALSAHGRRPREEVVQLTDFLQRPEGPEALRARLRDDIDVVVVPFMVMNRLGPVNEILHAELARPGWTMMEHDAVLALFRKTRPDPGPRQK